MRLAADLRTYRHLRWGMTALLVTIAIIPAAVWVTSSARTTASAGLVQPVGSSRQWVVAPGRVQPKDGVVSLAAPASQSQLTAPIVTALHVRPGEWVERGRVLATLQGREELDAALVGATRKVAVAEARLVALRSGAKSGRPQRLAHRDPKRRSRPCPAGDRYTTGQATPRTANAVCGCHGGAGISPDGCSSGAGSKTHPLEGAVSGQARGCRRR